MQRYRLNQMHGARKRRSAVHLIYQRISQQELRKGRHFKSETEVKLQALRKKAEEAQGNIKATRETDTPRL